MNSQVYFDQIAHDWDQMRESFFSNTVRDVAIATAEVQPGKIAADIGAGSGFMTEGLLQKGLHVFAVDQSEAMLEVMKTKFQDADRVTYLQGESRSLPIPDASVDYVFANMYLHHVEAPLATIKEMARILKPGGTLVITDLDKHDYEFLRTEQHDRWLGFERDAIKHWFAEAGLEAVNVDCVGENCCSESSCGCESASISIFVARGIKPSSLS